MNAAERLRAGRARAAVESLVEQELALAQDYAEIRASVPEVYAAYDKAFKKAKRTNDDVDWHRADLAQQACLNTSAAKRRLAQYFEEAV